MELRDKIGIVLTTFNRREKAERTLRTLLALDSPVREFAITVLDNNSTDSTAEMVRVLQQEHANVHYRKNPYNLGIAGNIAKAMESADKEYHWNICDDDVFTWHGWPEVVAAVESGEDVICVSNYLVKPQHRESVAYQLLQMSFVPAIIIRTRLFTDATMRNTFDNIFTLFPHLVPIVTHLNGGGRVKVIGDPIVTNGMEKGTDCSYLRGVRPDTIFHRSRTMTWMVGYTNILSNLSDRRLKRRCFDVVIAGDHAFRSGYPAFYSTCFFAFRGRENKMQLVDLKAACGFFSHLVLSAVGFLQNTPLFPLVSRLRDWKARLLP